MSKTVSVEDLKKIEGFRTELVSLFIPHDRKISDVINFLKNEISESQNIKTEVSRKIVLHNILALLGQLENMNEVPENGLVMYSGGNGLYILHPPEKIKTFRYHCASEFLLWPVEDWLERVSIWNDGDA